MNRFVFKAVLLCALCNIALAENTGGREDSELKGVEFEEGGFSSTTTEEPVVTEKPEVVNKDTEEPVVTETIQPEETEPEETVVTESPAAEEAEEEAEEKENIVLNIGGTSGGSSGGKGGKADKGGKSKGGKGDKAGKVAGNAAFREGGKAAKVKGGKGNKDGKGGKGDKGGSTSVGTSNGGSAFTLSVGGYTLDTAKVAKTSRTSNLILGMFAGIMGTMLISVYVKRRQRHAQQGYELMSTPKATLANEKTSLLPSGHMIPKTPDHV